MHKKPSTYKTTCSYCGVGCGIVIHKSPSGKLKLEGDKDHPVNKGMLCSKGRNLLHVVNDTSDRLLHPMTRNSIDEKFKQSTWDDSLQFITSKIKDTIHEYGSDSIGFYVSGQCLTEEYYVANKLVKGFIGTNNIDTNSRLCMSSAVMGYKLAFGDDIVPASYEDIELADCFFISGANPAWCHPILFRRLENHKSKNPDIKIIVVDPRKTDTCSIADKHLQIKPGSDITLNNAIAKVLVDEGLIDYEYLSQHANNFESLLNTLDSLNLEEAATICGIKDEDIRETARMIGNSKGFISMWAMGLNQSSEGVNKNLTLLNLSILTGQIGKPGSGPLSLTGQPNAMGGREVGGMATLLAAHHDLSDASHRKKIQRFWHGKEISGNPGLTATEMITALEEKKLKVVWIICTNPLVSLPNLVRAEKAFKNAELVVVQDISNKSDTLNFAHIVLPAAGWLEKEGTMTNSERRITYLNKVIDAPGEARPDIDILCHFARLMGYTGFEFSNSEAIFNEYKQLTSETPIDISALSYNSLKTSGSVQWPVTAASAGGTKRLFTDGKFLTNNGKANLTAVKAENLTEHSQKEFPFVLTTGRVRDQWHTMTRTGKVNTLSDHISKPYISMSLLDAQQKGLSNGDIVDVSNNRGHVQLEVKITDEVKPGVLFIPMHWGKITGQTEGRVNNLTSSHIDPLSKQPEYKFSSVNIKKLAMQKRKIIIIGSGAAAYSFIEQHRRINKSDQIIVFSKEKQPFYNRIQLPDYINENKEWNSLLIANEEELYNLNIELKKETSIVSIDKENNKVIDSHNNEHTYDKLIIATGSKPVIPDICKDIKNVYTIRTRKDADAIKSTILNHDVKHTSIIGSGILGIEMAAAINQLGINTTLIARGEKLMSRQLDNTAASILTKELKEKGIQICFNHAFQNLASVNNQLRIEFDDKSPIEADLVIFAIGTKPLTVLAVDCGLEVNNGIVVNEFMQTSDADIFAVGEVAEYNSTLYGITSAAEDQASACVNFLAGNYYEHFKGSVSENILKCDGFELCTLGNYKRKETIEEVVLVDSNKGYYKRCFIENDRLTGAILMGDTAEYEKFKELIKKKTELGEEREKLLRSGEKDDQAIGDLVCSCNRVGRGNLEYFIQNGCSSFEGLMVLTGAGTGCGSCKPEIKKIMAENEIVITKAE